MRASICYESCIISMIEEKPRDKRMKEMVGLLITQGRNNQSNLWLALGTWHCCQWVSKRASLTITITLRLRLRLRDQGSGKKIEINDAICKCWKVNINRFLF